MPDGDREVERDCRLADAALRREDGDLARAANAIGRLVVLVDGRDLVHEVVARERHRKHGVDAAFGARLDRILGNGQDDHGHAEALALDLLDQGKTLDPPLQEGVHQHHVRSQLLRRGDRLGAVRQDIEKLDVRLRVEEAAYVLCDLRDVLDEQEADLIAAGHSPATIPS